MASSSPTSRSSARRRRLHAGHGHRRAPRDREFPRLEQRAGWSPDGQTLAVTLSRDTGSRSTWSTAAAASCASSPAAARSIPRPRSRRRPRRVLRQRPRRRSADLPHHDQRRQRRARHVQRQLQHQPVDQPRWPHAGLHLARGWCLPAAHARPVDANAQPVALTDTSDDEHPSFAPNGRPSSTPRAPKAAMCYDDHAGMARSRPDCCRPRPTCASPRGGLTGASNQRSTKEEALMKLHHSISMRGALFAAVTAALLAGCSNVRSTTTCRSRTATHGRQHRRGGGRPVARARAASSRSTDQGAANTSAWVGSSTSTSTATSSRTNTAAPSTATRRRFPRTAEASVGRGPHDERGGREYNLALGQKRAEAVAKSLALLARATRRSRR